MVRWSPSQEWKGEDAYLIGGGSSLRHFDWDLLRGKNTIGCNSAFLLGADICKVTIFADYLWWEKIGKKGTESYGGRVVGCHPSLKRDETPWLLTVDREDNHNGLGEKDTLGFNGHTGSLALNLALLLGSRRVFLLGFDMVLGRLKHPELSRSKNPPNWHDLRYEDGKGEVYLRFVKGLGDVKRDLPRKFPGVEVLNLTETSVLPLFEKVPTRDHFQKNTYRACDCDPERELVTCEQLSEKGVCERCFMSSLRK